MADAAWKKLKDKVTAKRGKKRDTGDTTHKLLKGNELTVQRLSSRRRPGSFLQDFGADTGHEGNLREIRYW